MVDPHLGEALGLHPFMGQFRVMHAAHEYGDERDSGESNDEQDEERQERRLARTMVGAM